MGKKAPKAPDPYKTADAQAGMNRETAITQYGLAATNQENPWGSIGYEQIGQWDDGTPRFQQTTTLSPDQQAIFGAGQDAQLNLADIASEQSAFLGDYLNKPFNSNPALQTNAGQSGRIGGGYSTAFDPNVDLATTYAGADDFSADRQRVEDALWARTAGDRDQQEKALSARLANSGIRPGSAAYNAEMERMARQNTDARLATLLAGGQEQSRMVGLARDAAGFGNEATMAGAMFGSSQQQAQNAAALAQAGFGNQANMQNAQFANSAAGQQFAMDLARRNQPINEITALMSGSQVSNPAGMSGPTPQVPVGGVDYTGLVGQNYAAQLQQHQGALGSIGGMFGTILGGPIGGAISSGIGGLFGK